MFNQFVKDNEGKVKVAAQFNTGEQYGIGMKLGNTALKNVVDGAITEAKADGTYDAIYAKWIGGTPPAAAAAAAPHHRVTDLPRPVAGHRARPPAVFP